MTPRVVVFSGGRVWRTCDPGHWGALPGLCDARFAEDVLGDRHQGEAAAAVLSACLARSLAYSSRLIVKATKPVIPWEGQRGEGCSAGGGLRGKSKNLLPAWEGFEIWFAFFGGCYSQCLHSKPRLRSRVILGLSLRK